MYQQVRSWIEQAGNERWVLNFTGGIKLQSAFCWKLARLDNCSLVYLERRYNRLHTLVYDGDRVTLASEDFDPTVTDTIPVLKLIETQFGEDEGQWMAELLTRRLKVAKFVECGYKVSWDWDELLKHLKIRPGEMDTGHLFEQFVASSISTLGASNIAVNVLQTNNQRCIQEIDVVANRAGRLHIVRLQAVKGVSSSDRSDKKTVLRQLESWAGWVRPATWCVRDLVSVTSTNCWPGS